MQLVSKMKPSVLVTSGSFNIQHQSLWRINKWCQPAAQLPTPLSLNHPGLLPTMTGNTVSQPAWARFALFQVNGSMHWKKQTSLNFSAESRKKRRRTNLKFGGDLLYPTVRVHDDHLGSVAQLALPPLLHQVAVQDVVSSDGAQPTLPWKALQPSTSTLTTLSNHTLLSPTNENHSSFQRPHASHYQIKHCWALQMKITPAFNVHTHHTIKSNTAKPYK